MAGHDLFFDTSGLYALVCKRDAYHEKTAVLIDELNVHHPRFITTDYVVAEALNLAKARQGVFVAARLLEFIETSTGIHLQWIGPERFYAAKAFFCKHADHGYSFTDCTSFVVMRELGLRDALTTDRHFDEAGFKALLAGG